MLHILLSRTTHKLNETIKLCARIIEGGSDVNKLDSKNRLALQYLINMKYTDEELEPLYNIWLSQPNLNVNTRNNWGKTSIDIAKTIPYRKELLKRLLEYENQF